MAWHGVAVQGRGSCDCFAVHCGDLHSTSMMYCMQRKARVSHASPRCRHPVHAQSASGVATFFLHQSH